MGAAYIPARVIFMAVDFWEPSSNASPPNLPPIKDHMKTGIVGYLSKSILSYFLSADHPNFKLSILSSLAFFNYMWSCDQVLANEIEVEALHATTEKYS